MLNGLERRSAHLFQFLFTFILTTTVAFASGSEMDLSPEAQEQLYALGYLQTYNPAPTVSGVIEYDMNLAQDGVNLVLAPDKTGAYIMDMHGNILHRWSMNVYEDLPRLSLPDYVTAQEGETYEYWSRVEPLENGDIIVVYKYVGVFRLDKDSNVIWTSWVKAHHDADLASNGIIYTIARGSQAEFHKGEVIARNDDYVVALYDDGTEAYRFSIWNAFRRSEFMDQFQEAYDANTYLHTNKITRLDGRWASKHPAFAEGNILVSCRNIDTIAIIEPNSEEVVWMLQHDWVRQHEPILLEDTMLLFDNRGRAGESRVIEIDPFTLDIPWSFHDAGPRPFHSEVGGCSQRLPNGNTLITESTHGRAIEVTPEKEIVWEYINPERTVGPTPRVIPIFEVRRLIDYDTRWIKD